MAVGPETDEGGPGAAAVTLHVQDTGGWARFRTQSPSRLHLPAGRQTLSVRVTNKPGTSVMDLRQIVLTPVR